MIMIHYAFLFFLNNYNPQQAGHQPATAGRIGLDISGGFLWHISTQPASIQSLPTMATYKVVPPKL